MVNAGLIGATVVDRYKAIMWSRVFRDLKVLRAARCSPTAATTGS